MAGAQVAGALRRYGGAAAVRGGVALGQDRVLRAGRHLQGGTQDPRTPQLLWTTDEGTNEGRDTGNGNIR